MAYRAMAPPLALRQFDDLFQYADRCTYFDAVDNILPKSYLTDVLPHVTPPENVAIFYEVKADLSKADVELLSKAHVKRIQPGVESLATSTLKLMKKGTTAFQNIMLLKNCARHDIHPDWNLLIGFPGETEEVFKKYLQDIPLVVHLPPPSGAFQVRFDRYSPYFMHAVQYGLNLHPSDFYTFIYPFSEEVLTDIAYYFSDHNYSAGYIRVVSEWSASIREKIAHWRSLWDVESPHLRPKLIWKRRMNSRIVCDSRTGEEIEHRLGENAIQLLQGLEVPKRSDDLVTAFPGFNTEEELANLQQKGLVFEENKRYLSLVMDELEPAIEQAPVPLLAHEGLPQSDLAG